MQKETELFLLLIGVFVLVAVFGVLFQINNLQQQNSALNAQWEKIDTLYAKKIGLTSELINLQKGSLIAEDVIINEFNQAKDTYQSSKTIEQKVKNIVNLEMSIKKFIGMLDRYPEIQSQADVSQRVNEILTIGDNLSLEVSKYNDLVTTYNDLLKSFPKNLIAKLAGYSKRSQLLSV